MPSTAPVALFGAYDRHNFGDLLLARVAMRLLRGQPVCCAGLAARDLRASGGPRVRPLAGLAPSAPLPLLHVGGQLLSCSAWQAAAMLMPPDDETMATIAWLSRRSLARRRWARAALGLEDHAPYLLPRALAGRFAPVLALGLGGAGLEQCPRRMRAEVMDKLRRMQRVAVRDRATQALLREAGIEALLLPDPAALTAQLFGPLIRRRARHGEVAALRARFSGGYLAVQIAAEFGDDATLDALAAALDAVALRRGLGVALFLAGVAPWHDDAAVLRRLAARLRAPAALLDSIHLWDICALLAQSAGYCGSSLHGRIVATAFGRPRLNLLPPQTGLGMESAKHRAYVDSWEFQPPGCVAVGDAGEALEAALAVEEGTLRAQGEALARAVLEGFEREFRPWIEGGC
ncbi:polysaccharide pyruvyl transferase family protein [Azohydromonas caseinilytica]|uniref:Polysaccharide pyruvyl transferase family protein n=1 Tax=Azohydromonas caseinilytica TaxID=2728836 RepID=A0A848F5U7_9BURK|nr:polysaccharide pyruvyl transferase family protein [Azohydromonas caseinilytica]NML13959.1 polysaccharide pyruvyl transferase family protein [Azohydromonas caseinilytica]